MLASLPAYHATAQSVTIRRMASKKSSRKPEKKPVTKRKAPAKRTTKRKKAPACGSPTGGSRAQSLVFSKTKHARGKPKWTKARAKTWAKGKGYKYGKVDETAGEYRLRQFDPGRCLYRSQAFGNSGIRAILELPKRAPAHVVRKVEEELVRPRKKR